MAYLVLARKYRPHVFADMVGQEHVTRTLANAIAQDRVHHAYLFCGARGLGKTSVARVFAKGLVCEQGPTATPCNACHQCLAVDSGHSVDVLEIDGASNNSVDDIRELREQVHYLPQSARRKVYIIDEVHMLTRAAFNALLKTLEEPPAHINFIFATTEAHKLPATILSRVSRLEFRRLGARLLAQHLRSIVDQEKLAFDDEALAIIARAGAGSVRDALTLLDQTIAFCAGGASVTAAEVREILGQADRGRVSELMDAVLAGDCERTLAHLTELMMQGLDTMVLAHQLLEDLRDLLVVKLCPDADVLPDSAPGEIEALKARVIGLEASRISQLFDRLLATVEALPSSGVQHLVLEVGLLELASSEPLVPVTEILERLERLSSGGTSGGGPPSPGSGRGGFTPGSRPVPEFSRSPGRGADPRSSLTPAGPSPDVPQASAPPSVASAPPSVASAPPSVGPAETIPTAHAVQPVKPDAAETGRDESGPQGSAFAAQLWNLARSHGVVTPTPPSREPPRSEPPRSETPRSETPRPETPRSEPPRSEPPRSEPPRSEPPPPSGPARAPEGFGEIRVSLPDGSPSFAVWQNAVETIRAEDDYAAAVLWEVGYAGLIDGRLRLVVPPRGFAHEALGKNPELRNRVELALRTSTESPAHVEVVADEPHMPDQPSLALVQAALRAQAQAKAELAAREHPAIVGLVAAFEARIQATQPLASDARPTLADQAP